jgi:hypothetical protein
LVAGGAPWPKIAKNLFYLKGTDLTTEKLRMGTARLVFTRLGFIGAIATSLALTSPASAKNSSPNSHANANAQKVDEESEAQGCRAYQQAPDGSWVQLACHEGGSAAPAHGKSAQTR